MVLVIVLWTIALLAGLAMAASTTFRGFAGIVTVDRDRLRADALLTAGVETAAKLMADASDGLVDGLETTVTLPAGSVRVRLRDEGGRIDVGKAPEEVLVSLLQFVGAQEPRDIARRIMYWRDPDAASRPGNGASPPRNGAQASPAAQPGVQPVGGRAGMNGTAAGQGGAATPQGQAQGQDNDKPTAAPFTDVRLLARIPGLTPERVAALLPLATVFGSETVNPVTAPGNVLAALPGMDRERVAAILDARQRFASDPDRLNAILGPAQQYMQVKPQQAVSVDLVAKLADGFGTAAHAIIVRLQDDSEPYRVLSWTPLPYR